MGRGPQVQKPVKREAARVSSEVEERLAILTDSGGGPKGSQLGER